MSRAHGHRIKAVAPGSIAQQLGVQPGDVLMSIDGEEIEDVMDYRLRIQSESMVMLIRKPDGEEWELDIWHDYEDPGLEFESGLMSDYRRCANKCIFCFIDQMPEGMRETLYFKDDDSRLSFLQGNYVTLTNMKQHDIDRIIRYRLAPINISVHTTDPELRCRMLRNRFAGESLRYIDQLCEAGIPMNGQIVLCPGWNDGAQLEATLRRMLDWAPLMESVSVVPVGLTRYREGLPKIELCSAAKAAETIGIVEAFQKKAMEKCGIRFVYASDEFYLLAGRELPGEEEYGGYPQLENGVGMLRLLIEEVRDALEDMEPSGGPEELSVATGTLAYPVLKELIGEIGQKLPDKTIRLYAVENDFFGRTITVSGLVTGRDIVAQLKGKPLGDRLILPRNMFRSGEDTLLDDLTAADLERELGCRIVIDDASGCSLVDAIRDPGYRGSGEYRQYEYTGADGSVSPE